MAKRNKRAKSALFSRYTAVIGAGAVVAGTVMSPFLASATTTRSSDFTPVINALSDGAIHNPDRGLAYYFADGTGYYASDNVEKLTNLIDGDITAEWKSRYISYTGTPYYDGVIDDADIDVSIVEYYYDFMKYAEAGLPGGKVISDANLAKLQNLFDTVRNKGLKLSLVLTYNQNKSLYPLGKTNYSESNDIAAQRAVDWLDATETALDQILPIIENNKDVVYLVQDSCVNMPLVDYDGYGMASMYNQYTVNPNTGANMTDIATIKASASVELNATVYSSAYPSYYANWYIWEENVCRNIKYESRADLFRQIRNALSDDVLTNINDRTIAHYLSDGFATTDNNFGLSNYYNNIKHYENYWWWSPSSPSVPFSPLFDGLDSWISANSANHPFGGFLGFTNLADANNLVDSVNFAYTTGVKIDSYAEPTYGDFSFSASYNDLNKKLITNSGYRLGLTDGDVKVVDDTISVDVKLENTGLGIVTHKKDISLLFVDGAGTSYEVDSGVDLRDMINASGDYEVKFDVAYPASLPAGDYTTYLKITEPYASIKNDTNYALKLANEDTYDSTLVANKLGSITITATTPTPPPAPTPDPDPDPVPDDVPAVPDTGVITKTEALEATRNSLISFGAILLGATIIFNLCSRRAHRHIFKR